MEFLVFLFVVFAISFLVRKIREKKQSNNQKRLVDVIRSFQSTAEEKKSYSREYNYSLNDSLMTSAEIRYYKHLDGLIGDNMRIFSKVRLLDIFTPKDNNAFASMRKISSKHVDFLVCEDGTFKPLFAIELDDSSHRSMQAQERDIFVNSVFKAAGLTLHRVECKGSYSELETKTMLKAS